MIVMRGYFPAGNLHTERLRQAPLGHFFNVITNGYGAMPDYQGQVDVEDRWAIAAYIRALQLSQHATVADAGGAHVDQMADVEQREGFRSRLHQGLGPAHDCGSDQGAGHHLSSSAPAHARRRRCRRDRCLQGWTGSGGKPEGDAVRDRPACWIQANLRVDRSGQGRGRLQPRLPPRPHMLRSAMLRTGQKLYTTNCSVCHQPTRAGMPPMIPSLVGIVGRVGAAHIHTQVANGSPTSKPPMPAFPQLSNENVNDIVAFLAASK